MEQKQVQLKDLSIVELKATVYDANMTIMANEKAIKIINDEINNRQNTVPVEAPKEETKTVADTTSEVTGTK